MFVFNYLLKMSLLQLVRHSPIGSLSNFRNANFHEGFSKRLHVSSYNKASNDPNFENVNSSTTSKEKTVDFGFQTVLASEKAEKVHKVFENVASKYDLMNDVMSVGIHRIWKDYFVKKMFPLPPGTSIIDVAGGTGKLQTIVHFKLSIFSYLNLTFQVI